MTGWAVTAGPNTGVSLIVPGRQDSESCFQERRHRLRHCPTLVLYIRRCGVRPAMFQLALQGHKDKVERTLNEGDYF
jgi:hypothetical protein